MPAGLLIVAASLISGCDGECAAPWNPGIAMSHKKG